MLQRNNLLNRIVARVFRAQGYSRYFASRMYGTLSKDLTRGAKLGARRRLWAYRNGWLGDTLVNYGLTPENCAEYVADLPYMKLHPLNGRWSKWIDDKLTLRYVLASFAKYLPEYYFQLVGSQVLRLMDCPEHFGCDVQGIISLLRAKNQLAVKVIAGTGGEGFFKLSTDGDVLLVNDRPFSLEEFSRFISECRAHVVTEYVVGHAFLKSIYPHTANTLRVCTIHEPGSTPAIAGSFIRFGTSRTGAVDNVTAGGIVAGVRLEDGELFRPGTYQDAEFVELSTHPDTGASIQGNVPNWQLVRDIVLRICDYLPQLPYLGFDIVVTEGGFKIIEINSHPSSHVLQQYYPLLRNPASRHFFLGALQAKGIRTKVEQAPATRHRTHIT